MEAKSCPQNKIKVIVRAWGDEPVALFLYIIENKRTYVRQEHSGWLVGLLLEQGLLPDNKAFSSLMAAFESGSAGKLASSYSRLAVNGPCLNEFQFRWNTRKMDAGQRVSPGNRGSSRGIGDRRKVFRETGDRREVSPILKIPSHYEQN